MKTAKLQADNITSTVHQVVELDDRSSTGRQRPWRECKMGNILLAAAYDEINPDKAARLRDCASWLQFRLEPDGRKVLDVANFCRVRLCPVCSWRRSLKAQAQMMQIAEYLRQGDKQYSYILLTLTARNVAGEELENALNYLMLGWQRLIQRQCVSDVVHGYYRSLEITHNITDGTYHPHYHVLLAVDLGYYKHKYLTQATWTELWRQSMRLDYTPIVDVRRVKGGNDASAIAEIAKYAVKPGDYLLPDDWDMTVDVVRLLDRALNHRRLLAYGGVIADAHRRLHLDDVEDGDLTRVDDREQQDDDGAPRIVFWWWAGYRQYRTLG